MNWFEILKMVGPILAIILPKIAPYVPTIISGIHEAEQLHDGDLSGAEKRAHVVGLVSAGITAAQTAAGNQAIDNDSALVLAGVATDLAVSLANEIHLAHVAHAA